MNNCFVLVTAVALLFATGGTALPYGAGLTEEQELENAYEEPSEMAAYQQQDQAPVVAEYEDPSEMAAYQQQDQASVVAEYEDPSEMAAYQQQDQAPVPSQPGTGGMAENEELPSYNDELTEEQMMGETEEEFGPTAGYQEETEDFAPTAGYQEEYQDQVQMDERNDAETQRNYEAEPEMQMEEMAAEFEPTEMTGLESQEVADDFNSEWADNGMMPDVGQEQTADFEEQPTQGFQYGNMEESMMSDEMAMNGEEQMMDEVEPTAERADEEEWAMMNEAAPTADGINNYYRE